MIRCFLLCSQCGNDAEYNQSDDGQQGTDTRRYCMVLLIAAKTGCKVGCRQEAVEQHCPAGHGCDAGQQEERQLENAANKGECRECTAHSLKMSLRF